MSGDRPILGILLMLAFCALAPVADGIAKLLGPLVSLATLLVVRFGAQTLILAPMLLRPGALPALSRRETGLIVLRSLLHIVGIGLMFLSLRAMPLADAIAIAFVMPLLLLLLAKYLLGEDIGPRRVIACGVGFAGALMVIQPSFVSVGSAALLPLGVAVAFAGFVLVTRKLAVRVAPVPLQAISGAVALALLALWLLLAPEGPETRLQVPPGTGPYLLALGVLGTLAHLLMTWSLRFAPAATLAPIQYLEIPFATLVGWLMFRDLPDGLAAAGIVVTVATGLYILHRERRTEHAAKSAAVAPPAS